MSENPSQGLNPANDGKRDLQELKRRVSPRLLPIPGVSGVGIRGGTLTVYLSEDSESVRQEVAAVLKSENASAPVNFVVSGAIRAWPARQRSA